MKEGGLHLKCLMHVCMGKHNQHLQQNRLMDVAKFGNRGETIRVPHDMIRFQQCRKPVH